MSAVAIVALVAMFLSIPLAAKLLSDASGGAPVSASGSEARLPEVILEIGAPPIVIDTGRIVHVVCIDPPPIPDRNPMRSR